MLVLVFTSPDVQTLLTNVSMTSCDEDLYFVMVSVPATLSFSKRQDSERSVDGGGWLMFVQSMMTLALMFALGALVLLSVVLMRYMLRFEIIFLLGAFILEAITAVPVFLSVAVFGGMCFDRSWLQYPNYNHLSWAYALAVVAFFFHTLAAVMLLGEAFKARERRRRANNLIYNMQPRS
ncbi:hypothetical protein HPB51_003004 [Rhipicephalus microplus]|uniref:Uncharacterized protein n=1 Tax=Rhipicephalus microplus TaxID=6941 RepID=A0A9J6DT94_RHIMP|nr:hypothetical protein HPB51_003004 [Rhipicephalus microplus]